MNNLLKSVVLSYGDSCPSDRPREIADDKNDGFVSSQI